MLWQLLGVFKICWRNSQMVTHQIQFLKQLNNNDVIIITEPYGVRVNFPNIPDFTGVQVKKYPIGSRDTVNDVIFILSIILFLFHSFFCLVLL